MKEVSFGHFYGKLNNNARFPLSAQLELTYRCGLECVHCYCKGLENKGKELSTGEWKKILDDLVKEGIVYLTFTGGDPLAREDFLELYAYAREKAFLTSIFTNAQSLTSECLDHLSKSPPYSIEVTLNGITQGTYESITQVSGSFAKATENIRKIKEENIPLFLKVNCLKQNKHEVGLIKAFVDKFLGGEPGKFHFKYDPMVYPRLNGDKTPCKYRLSFDELSEIRKQDPDIWEEYQKGLHSEQSELKRDRKFLYGCNSWESQFFIDPFGRLKFCEFSDKFSVDLKKTPLRAGYYSIVPQVLGAKFTTDSKCVDCSLRPLCYHCPGRAYLETGNEESPVDYYCEMAGKLMQELSSVKQEARHGAKTKI